MSDDHTIRLQSDEQLDTVNEQLRLIRRKNGLTFGTDAYLLAAFVRSQPRERAVDLGSGTGILSLLLCARNKVRSVIAAEVQPVFAELTERNAALNGMADRIRVFAGDVRTLGLRDTDGEVGLVLSNPPYLRAGSGRLGGLESTSPIRPICGQARADPTGKPKRKLHGMRSQAALPISALPQDGFCGRAADSAWSGNPNACANCSPPWRRTDWNRSA